MLYLSINQDSINPKHTRARKSFTINKTYGNSQSLGSRSLGIKLEGFCRETRHIRYVTSRPCYNEKTVTTGNSLIRL